MIPTPHIEAKKGDFAKTVLMPGDPKRAKFIADNFLTDAKLVNDVRGVQGYTGFYANCYANKSLKGKWTVTDIEGNPIPLEWADTEANPLIK